MSAPWWTTAERRADGWPLCPRCEGDELWSASIPARIETIVGCYTCGWKAPPKDAAAVLAELRAVMHQLPAGPMLGSFLVAPDVHDALVAQLRTVSTGAAGFSVPVRIHAWLPPGTVIPLDTAGRPMPKPHTGGST